MEPNYSGYGFSQIGTNARVHFTHLIGSGVRYFWGTEEEALAEVAATVRTNPNAWVRLYRADGELGDWCIATRETA